MAIWSASARSSGNIWLSWRHRRGSLEHRLQRSRNYYTCTWKSCLGSEAGDGAEVRAADGFERDRPDQVATEALRPLIARG